MSYRGSPGVGMDHADRQGPADARLAQQASNANLLANGASLRPAHVGNSAVCLPCTGWSVLSRCLQHRCGRAFHVVGLRWLAEQCASSLVTFVQRGIGSPALHACNQCTFPLALICTTSCYADLTALHIHTPSAHTPKSDVRARIAAYERGKRRSASAQARLMSVCICHTS